MSMPLSSEENTIRRLARLHGIACLYRDGCGRRTVVPSDTLRYFLRLMNIPASTKHEVRDSLRVCQTRFWTQLVDDVLVVQLPTQTRRWVLIIPESLAALSGVRVDGVLEDEAGQRTSFHCTGTSFQPLSSRMVQGTGYVRVSCPWPTALAMGYYLLHLTVSHASMVLKGDAMVIVAPEACYQPAGPARAWGMMVQLYGMQSPQNWGIGDFHDAQRLLEWAGRDLGAAMVGLNPLHALPPDIISPYSPSSRLFHNPLYLHVETIEEYRSTPSIRRMVRSRAFQGALHACRHASEVQYQEVRQHKQPVFEALYRAFQRQHLRRGTKRACAFRQFVHGAGSSLHQFALFQALHDHFQGLEFQRWPFAFRSPASPEVEHFAIRHRDRLALYQYVEWQCALQLQDLDETASRLKMDYGVYHDLAIGVHPNGADAWMFQDQLAGGATIGAPPDFFNQLGQNWGVLPALPRMARTQQYRFFRDTIRQTMQHGGLLRLDHALGLFRLFWIPMGGSVADGTYVHYPTDEWLAILAIESHRSRVAVVGEDVGTVTTRIRKRLKKGGLLSSRIPLFEKSPGLAYPRSRRFPAQALIAATTHDLPTFRGFWMGRDIEVKAHCGLYPSQACLEAEKANRVKVRQALCHALHQEGLLPQGVMIHADDVPEFTDALCRAVYAFLARTPCRLLAVPFEDLAGELDTPNVPEAPPGLYPVWQRKIAMESLIDNREIRSFASMLQSERQL
ncbi:MAG: 4-alpha-glucanotransferase [Nitrospirales bacterium]|nr:4-alpha-glucanotransferase [Nitrospirales bacterium]